MTRLFTVSILLAAFLPLFGASLEYSGALGQSQPEKFTPVPFTPVYSAAADSSAGASGSSREAPLKSALTDTPTFPRV